MKLEQQIAEKRKEIFTDAYPMSIGELVNMYKDEELEINPSFQRFFRWTKEQQVKFIESILLGIPIPSIFVAQRDDGVWELVDGLQRVSTILNFMGELVVDGSVQDAFILNGTEYLPLLNNVSWDSTKKRTDGAEVTELDSALKRSFKREKIEIKIVQKESDGSTKFELFQRLNTGGSALSDQEVRNCLLIMLNNELYERLERMSAQPEFVSTLMLTDRLIEQRYDMELILRLLSVCNSTGDELRRIGDVSVFITEKLKLFSESDMDWDKEEEVIANVFKILDETLGDFSFRKYIEEENTYKGGFQLSMYEIMSTGVYLYLKSGKDIAELPAIIDMVSKKAPTEKVFKQFSGSGSRANYRWPNFSKLAKKYFLNENS
ncbi:DUF262 domain-containing protein [Enterovibrio sp. Hal110]